MEGRISLGIYDSANKLVRVLHREAALEEFTVGDDALQTRWDGKNNEGQDLPAGKYKARGYLVGNLKVERVEGVAGPPPDATPGTPATAGIKLMANPLAGDRRPTIKLAVGFKAEKAFLQLEDELPILTLSQKPNLARAVLRKAGEKSAEVWLDDGTAMEQLRISNLDKMMGFDAGDFDLK